MGLCGSKKYNQLISPSKSLKHLQTCSIGNVTNSNMEISQIIGKQKPILNDIAKNLIFDFTTFDQENHNLTKEQVVNDILKDYPNLQNIQITSFDQQHFTVTAEQGAENSFICVKRHFFKNFENFSNMLSYLLSVRRLNFAGTLPYKQMKILQRDDFYIVDRSFDIPAIKLEQYVQQNKWNYKDKILILQVLKKIAENILELHSKGFPYRILRPENILILHGDLKVENIVLNSASYIWTEKEKAFLTNYITDEKDFFKYDCFCLCLMTFYLLNPPTQFNDLMTVKQQNDIEKFLEESQDIPQILMDTLKYILIMDKNRILEIEVLLKVFQSLINKGPQTNFKHDSLGAYLCYHSKKHIKLPSSYIFYTRKNQIHFYNMDTQLFNIIKMFRKKKKFIMKSLVSFNVYDDHFYFFANNHSNKVVRIQFEEKLGLNMLYLKCEVEFFKTLRNVQVQDPQVFCNEISENQCDIYIFNNKSSINPDVKAEDKKKDVFYSSYIIQISTEQSEKSSPRSPRSGEDENDDDEFNDEDDEEEDDDEKQQIKIFEGPRDYQWRRFVYYFYDQHNKYFYCIPDSNNIFQNGIRYSYYDTTLPNKDFQDGLLRFACASETIFEEFTQLNFKIKQINFCVEAQHGVFLMHASKNIFILDFNYKCFYSYASLWQLQNFEENQKKYPLLYQNAYETRDQPFEIKFQYAQCLGRNVVFQDGFLFILGRKEIETVLCRYKLLPEQAAVVLRDVTSLHSKQSLLQNLPTTISDVIEINDLLHAKDELFGSSNPQKIGLYTVVKKILEKDNLEILQVYSQDNRCYDIRKVKILEMKEYEYIQSIIEQQVYYKFLIWTKECFLTKKGNDIFVNIVEEHRENNLENEIRERKKQRVYFKPKEIGFLVKMIFKSIIKIKGMNIIHGNILPYQVNFLSEGSTKLSGWYQVNRKDFTSDFLDGCNIIFQCVSLEPSDGQFSLAKFQASEQIFQKYPGLFNFISKIVQQVQQSENLINLDVLRQDVKLLYKILQKEDIEFNQISSPYNHIFWVGYGSNYIISVLYDKQTFCKTEIKTPEDSSYKFSKYNMFAFNSESTMYISGAIKDDLKEQSFYQLDFTFIHNQQVKLKKLDNIPFNILSPTLLFLSDTVYCFGGYQVFQNGSKTASREAFSFNTKKKIWTNLEKLPVSLVNSTALGSSDKTLIYLFGGISEDIDLTGTELCFFVYDRIKNSYIFKMDLAMKSPFANSRFMKPIVDRIGDDLFVSFLKNNDTYNFEFFEIQRGGIRLKFKYQEKENKDLEIENQERDIFNDELQLEYQKVLQDDLSLIVKKDVLYNLDEESKTLQMIKFQDVNSIKIERVPCAIIGEANFDQHQSFEDNVSY